MATCPRCHGHLTQGHRCRRSGKAVAFELAATAMVGGLAAIAFTAVFDPHALTIDLDVLLFAAGAITALAAHRVFTWIRHPR